MHVKKKILMPTTGVIKKRGVENFEMNLYEHLDHSRFSVDFVTSAFCENEKFKQVVKPYGDNLVEFNLAQKSSLHFYIQSFFCFYKWMKKHKYDVVHINAGNIVVLADLALASRLAGVPKIIVHARNGGFNSLKHNILKVLLYPIINFVPDIYLTVSDVASLYEYPKKKAKHAIMIKNGTSIEKYLFREQNREKIREMYGFGNAFVIGHVGAFSEQKNHLYLLKIFQEYLSIDESAKLVLIGADGPEKERCIEYINEMKLQKNILLVGRSSEVDAWYSAFDVFVLPSIYEGFPNCMVEAQINGLPCIVSDAVTKEADILESRVSYLPIAQDSDISKWVNVIKECEAKEIDRNIDKDDMLDFDMNEIARKVESYYS